MIEALLVVGILDALIFHLSHPTGGGSECLTLKAFKSLIYIYLVSTYVFETFIRLVHLWYNKVS